MLDFDLGRTLRNGLIGAMFGPVVHYYYDFSDWILPQEVPVNRIFKIVMDQVRTRLYLYNRYMYMSV